MAGLAPDNIRLEDDDTPPAIGLPTPEDDPSPDVPDPDEPDENGDVREFDADGNTIRIIHADGGVTVSVDGQPVERANRNDGPGGWYANLADRIDPQERSQIVERILRGITDDTQARQDWIDDRAEGMKLLALKVEQPDTSGSPADGAAVEGMSRVRHPLLLEATLRFHANAVGEFIPVDGPVKIRDDNNNANSEEDELADAFEKDFNHYLTVTAKEWGPDTDRMLLKTGFGGWGIKKIFFCPLRNRPVSESVDPNDLIVDANAVSLQTARRVTHVSRMAPSLVRRMQILGVYRDIELTTPNEVKLNQAQMAEKDQQGITSTTANPEDRDREVYETYTELDLKDYEHKWKGKSSGLEVPYRVTIDLSSREMLSLVRDYPEDTKELPERRETFVDYIFVPGFGFYPIGLLHILANTTNAVTAAWRIMLDNGMFSNFPGGLVSKAASRQNTTINRVAPGSFSQIDTNGMPIRDAVMELPYNSQGMPALMSLTENIVQQGQRVGMTSEQPVGEGKDNAPVGTTLALIEQAQKVLSSAHKRMFGSLARELQLIAKCFRDHPESFWQQNREPARKWDQETFRRALDNSNLIPQADPNTASHMQRIMKVQALKQLQATNQTLYDPIAVERVALRTLGYSNPEQFLAPPEAMAKPPPEVQAKQAELALKDKEITAKMQQGQGELAIKQALAQAQQIKGQADGQKAQQEAGLAGARFQMEKENSDVDNKVKIVKTQLDGALENRKIDAATSKDTLNERIQLIDVAQNLAVHPESAHLVEPLIKPAWDDVNRRTVEDESKKKGLAGGEVDLTGG